MDGEIRIENGLMEQYSLYYDHYKDTFEQQKIYLEKRDHLTLFLLVIKFIPVTCIFNQVTGIYCPACGMTRAFLSILHFDFKAAYQYNPKVIVVFPLTVGAYLCYWIKKIK